MTRRDWVVWRALRAGAALALLLGIGFASAAEAQFARIAPPAPCRVPDTERLPLLPAAPATGAAANRPVLVIFTFERGHSAPERLHTAWSIPDRVARRLGASRGITVRSSGTVARAIYEAGGSLDSAAALLRAHFVLSGRVDFAEGKEEVRVELRRTGDRTPAWRGVYREGASLRALEETITAEVARRVAPGAPLPPVTGYPGNDGAYDALAAGEFHMLSPTVAGTDSAVRFLEQALTAAPESPVVVAQLARALAAAVERGARPAAGNAVIDRLPALLERALARDSTLPALWTARAVHARVADPVGFGRAVVYLRRALALAPNDADALHELGLTQLRLGDLRAAEESFRRALLAEPNRATTLVALAELALDAERWPAACAAANAAIGARPFDAWPYAIRALARIRLGQSRDAFADAEIANRLARTTWSAALRVIVIQRAGDRDVARRTLQQQTGAWLGGGRTMPVRDAAFVARAYLGAGDRRRALEAIRRASPVGTDLVHALGHADLAAVRTDTLVTRLVREGGRALSGARGSVKPPGAPREAPDPARPSPAPRPRATGAAAGAPAPARTR